ncbi:MAG TPA: pitrilysin family protein [Chloroflexota bacterium]
MTTTSSPANVPLQRRAANGLQLVASPCNGGLATIAVALPCGTTDESGATPLGASLLLGRLLTQGSQQFPDAETLAMYLETLGGVYNAGTDQDVTAIIASVPADELEAALRAVVDITTRPLLESRVLRVERRRLAGQFRAATAVPSSRAGDLADKLLWPDSAEGRTSQEMARAIPRLDRPALAALHEQRFGAGSAALAIATPGDMGAALDMAESTVASWPGGKAEPAPPPAIGNERVAAAAMPADLAYLSLAAPAVPRGHPDADGLNLAAVVLGGGATSRLFVEVREKRGLCYGIGCRYIAQANTGALRIEAGVPADRLDDAIKAILEQLQDLAAAGNEEEVAKARALLLGHLAMESDRPETWARRYSRDLVQLGRIRTYADIVTALEAVTTADVRRITAAYLAPALLRFSVAGPGVRRAQLARYART